VDELVENIEKLDDGLREMTEIRDGYKKRYLEEREARKDLQKDIRRIRKECKAQVDWARQSQN